MTHPECPNPYQHDRHRFWVQEGVRVECEGYLIRETTPEHEQPHVHGDPDACKHHTEFIGAEILSMHRELARQALQRAEGDPMKAQMILYGHYESADVDNWPLSVAILAVHMVLSEQLPKL